MEKKCFIKHRYGFKIKRYLFLNNLCFFSFYFLNLSPYLCRPNQFFLLSSKVFAMGGNEKYQPILWLRLVKDEFGSLA
jgi:uncharacterized protein YfdQ (DUF2303 family)